MLVCRERSLKLFELVDEREIHRIMTIVDEEVSRNYENARFVCRPRQKNPKNVLRGDDMRAMFSKRMLFQTTNTYSIQNTAV